jgi:hypothetical protein
LGEAPEVTPAAAVPFEGFAGKSTFFFEEFGLQFANEAGAGGIDDLKFFCDEKDGL